MLVFVLILQHEIMFVFISLFTSCSLFKELKPPNLYCVTAPCGDKSLSYIHSIKKPSFEAQKSKAFQKQVSKHD